MSWSAVRTVAVLELRQRVRSTRWQIMLVVWGVVLVLLCGGLTALAGMTGSEAEDTAPILYDLTVCFVLGIGLIIAPTLSATSVNGDRADATLALLQATRLRSQEIVVGKLVAAWSAALAFLAVALPFLLVFTLLGGAAWMTLAGHLLILVVTLGAVCAIGLGFSAATARPSASAVLTYLVVAGLVIGSPIITAISTTAVQGKQTTLSYETDYSASTNGKVVCETEPHVRTSNIVHVERIWWMLVPDPFVALADVSGRSMVYGEQLDVHRIRYAAVVSGVSAGDGGGGRRPDAQPPAEGGRHQPLRAGNDVGLIRLGDHAPRLLAGQPGDGAGPGRLVADVRLTEAAHARAPPRPRHASGLTAPDRRRPRS